MLTIRLRLVIVLMAIGALCAPVLGKEYKDPGGAFTLDLPEGWQVQRQELPGVGVQTFLGTDDDDAVVIEIVAMKGDKELDDQAMELGKTIVEQALAGMKEEGTSFRSKQSGKTTFAGRNAYRADAVYVEDDDDVVQQGTMIAVAGKHHLLVITAYGPKSSAKEQKKAADALASLLVEGAKISGDKPKASGLMNAARLKAAADVIKGNLKETAPDTVLVQGQVTLTYAAVKAYIESIEFTFDMELTETELQLAREKFIEVFKEGAPEGQQMLTVVGARVLEYLRQGTAQEQAKKKAELREGMTRTFAAQAQQGNAWAVTMNEAIARRASKVATISDDKPKPKFAEEGGLKTQLTEADLDASLEMLYFMWVASGRPAEAATPEAIAQIRLAIATNFSNMDPKAQYLFANAEAIYARMRLNWAAASEQERQAYAAQFASALDELGLTAPQAQKTGSAWDDVAGKDPSEMRAELVHVTCWNLAQKSR